MSVIRQSLTCSDFEQLVDSYLDGEMLPAAEAEFKAHIAQCPECESLLESCEFITHSAKLLADEPIPQMVSLRLRQVLQDELGLLANRSRSNLVVVK